MQIQDKNITGRRTSKGKAQAGMYLSPSRNGKKANCGFEENEGVQGRRISNVLREVTEKAEGDGWWWWWWSH